MNDAKRLEEIYKVMQLYNESAISASEAVARIALISFNESDFEEDDRC